MRSERSLFALSSSARRDALSPFPPRLMKYVSIRMPDPGPLGETFFDASERAIVSASFVNSPLGGNVETVLTDATHRLPERPFTRDCALEDRDFPFDEDLLELRPAMRTSHASDAHCKDHVA
jgi:hypothetical protein